MLGRGEADGGEHLQQRGSRDETRAAEGSDSERGDKDCMQGKKTKKTNTHTYKTHMRQTCSGGLKGPTSHCYSDLAGVRVPASLCQSHSSHFITFPPGHKVLSNLTLLKGTLHIV